MATAVRRLSDADLAHIQGNILAPFKRPHQRFVFLSLGHNRAKARDWIAGLGAAVTTTKDVLDRADGIWKTVSLTSSALVMLHPELLADVVGYPAFWRGALSDRERPDRGWMAPAALVGDPAASDPARWVVGAPGSPPIDALVTLAGDSDADLNAEATRFEQGLPDGIVVLSTVAGTFLEGGKEHFGFKDGISQPGIRGFSQQVPRNGRLEIADASEAGTPIIAAGEFVLGYEREPGSYPEARRPVPPAWMHDGSFQVFLRLTQDVEGWRRQMDEQSADLGFDVAARAIGRYSDGTPLAYDVLPGSGRDALNDFFYSDDPEGSLTPRCAHIRKMNPRDDAPFNARTHQLLRRGIPFEENGERGLAFSAYMGSIEDQFEYLMRSWASNPQSLPPSSPPAFDGPDPVVGASAEHCTLRVEGGNPAEIAFGRFVRTTAAVYAFAPSKPVLGMLGGDDVIPVG